jgi:predicted nuclease of predicted toxin-antitoxin system
MKLLFDQNLAPSLANRLSDLFPESSHTELAGLGRANDISIWQYCLQEGFVIVSKDNGNLSSCQGETVLCAKDENEMG